MALFLGLLGGAAAVEMHRSITRNFDDERNKPNSTRSNSAQISAMKEQRLEMITLIESLKRKESSLQASIAAVTQELEQSEAKSKAEHDRLQRVCSQLKEQLETAEAQHRTVCQAYNELQEMAKSESAQHAELKSLHASLLEENEMLISQFERLKTKHDMETSMLQGQIDVLQESVSRVVTEYVYGVGKGAEMTMEELEAKLAGIGVELGEGERARLEAGLKVRRGKERARVVEGLEVVVEGAGIMDVSNYKCANSPTRAARLFFASSKEESAPDTIKAVHGAGVERKVAKGKNKGKIVVPVTRELAVAGKGKVGVRV